MYIAIAQSRYKWGLKRLSLNSWLNAAGTFPEVLAVFYFMEQSLYQLKENTVVISLEEYNRLISLEKALTSDDNIKIITVEQDTYCKSFVKIFLRNKEQTHDELVNMIEVLQKELTGAKYHRDNYETAYNELKHSLNKIIVNAPKKWWQF